MSGEPDLELPQNVAIDFSPDPANNLTSLSQATPTNIAGTNYYDILFTPAGSVQQFGAPVAKYILWVHDISLDPAGANRPSYQGQPALIVVYTRTGAIAAHPVNADAAGNAGSGGIYSFTQDGRASGM
jgi:hypothetical protein